MYLCLSLGSCGVLYLCYCNYNIQYGGWMAGGKGVSTWSETVRTWAKAVHKRRHLARSPTASSTRSVTRIQTGQPQGRTTAAWPKAARDHDARGASLFAILSQSSSDNPSAKIMEESPAQAHMHAASPLLIPVGIVSTCIKPALQPQNEISRR